MRTHNPSNSGFAFVVVFDFEGFAVLSANLWHEHADGRANMEGRLAAERARVVAFHKSNPGFSVVCRPCYNDLFELLNDLNYAKVWSLWANARTLFPFFFFFFDSCGH
jgi:hypothetical protein